MVNGKEIKCVDMEHLNGMMDVITKVIFKMISQMEMDKCTIQMEQNIKGLGQMVNKMDRENYIKGKN